MKSNSLEELAEKLNHMKFYSPMGFRRKIVSTHTFPNRITYGDIADGISSIREVMRYSGSFSIYRFDDSSYYLVSARGKSEFQLAFGIKEKPARWQVDENYVRATIASFVTLRLDRQIEIRISCIPH